MLLNHTDRILNGVHHAVEKSGQTYVRDNRLFAPMPKYCIRRKTFKHKPSH